MGRVSYSEEYSDNQQGERFPKIKLERGETKRILCPEPPWSEYTHDLRLPKIVDGQQLFEKRKRQDQTEYMVPDTVWLANVICLGDKATLKQQGLDPVNCPACAASQTNKNIPGPKRRYAMNVVEYGVMHNGQLAQPFSARYVVWAFTSRMFDQLTRISNEHNGQLQGQDLRIGPPEEPVHFQKYPIAALPSLGWKEAGQVGFAYLQALTNAPGARATDEQLRDHCGTAKSAAQMTADVNRCVQEWTAAENAGATTPASPFAGQQPFAAQQALDQGFGQLLGQPGQPQFAQGGQVQQPAAAQAGANPFGAPQQPAAQQFPQPGASPFGAPTPQQGFAQPAAAQAQQGTFNPFQAPPGTPTPHPLESQAAMASAQQQQMAQTPFAQPQPGASPFGAPAQQAPPAQQFPTQQQAAPAPGQGNPFGSVAPAQGGGLGEFAAATTSNPSPEAAAQMAMQQQAMQAQQFQQPGQQQFAPQQQQQLPQQPGQPQGFAPVPMQVPGMPQPGQQAQPGQQPQTGDLSFQSFFPPTQ